MATCVQEIQASDISSLEILYPNTISNFFVTSSNKKLYQLEIEKQETIKFEVNLYIDPVPGQIAVTVNFYTIVNGFLYYLGNAPMTELTVTFQKDLAIGFYIICISSSYHNFSGDITGFFTGFPVYSKFPSNYFSGQSIETALIISKPDRVCNETIYFELVEGSLPPGVTLDLGGNLTGQLPNLDCIEDNKELSPSQNWYYDTENKWYPWGRQWRFKIRVWIPEFPEAEAFEWFCIKVHNNWSWDKDNFHEPFQYENKTIKKEIEEEKPQASLPSFELCPCEEEHNDLISRFIKWHSELNEQDTENPDIQIFINRFKTTDLYKSLTSSANIDERAILEKSIADFEEWVKNIKLINGRRKTDLDYKMLELKDKVNQSLPITLNNYTNEMFSLKLS